MVRIWTDMAGREESSWVVRVWADMAGREESSWVAGSYGFGADMAGREESSWVGGFEPILPVGGELVGGTGLGRHGRTDGEGLGRYGRTGVELVGGP